MKPAQIFSAIVLLLTAVSCEKSYLATDESANSSLISSVRNGTAIGNINLDEFSHEIELKPTAITYLVKDRAGNILKTCTSAEDAADWNKVVSTINFESFKQLPPIDCANCPALGDIGYEWLDITQGTESHRVTFATGSDLQAVTDLLKLLRAKRTAFDKTCP